MKLTNDKVKKTIYRTLFIPFNGDFIGISYNFIVVEGELCIFYRDGLDIARISKDSLVGKINVDKISKYDNVNFVTMTLEETKEEM